MNWQKPTKCVFIVRYNRVFVITEFVITEFVIIEFDCNSIVDRIYGIHVDIEKKLYPNNVFNFSFIITDISLM